MLLIHQLGRVFQFLIHVNKTGTDIFNGVMTFYIEGKTSIGRATVKVLHMNKDEQIELRKLLKNAGLRCAGLQSLIK